MSEAFEQVVEEHMRCWRAAFDQEYIPFPFESVLAGEGLGGALGAAELEAILRVSNAWPDLGECNPDETVDDLRSLVVGVVADGERVVLQHIINPDRRIRQEHINDWTIGYMRPGAARDRPRDWDCGWGGEMVEIPIIMATLGTKQEPLFIAPWLDVAQIEHQFDQAIKAAEQYQRRR